MRIRALTTYMQRDRDRPRLLLRIDTEDGPSGWGECYDHGPDRALPPLLEYLLGRSSARIRGGSSASS